MHRQPQGRLQRRRIGRHVGAFEHDGADLRRAGHEPAGGGASEDSAPARKPITVDDAKALAKERLEATAQAERNAASMRSVGLPSPGWSASCDWASTCTRTPSPHTT